MDFCANLALWTWPGPGSGILDELVEDVLGLLPGGARGFVVAGGVMGVCEAAKYGGMVLVVA